jgi:hypothetical protein
VTAPRATVAPITVSDATALAVVGLTPRQFRAFVREQGIPRVRVGRRTLVRVDRLLEAIDRLSGATPRPCAAAWDEQATIEAAARGAK